MRTIEKAWFTLGRAFSYLDIEKQNFVFQKLNLFMNDGSSASQFKEKKFFELANELSNLFIDDAKKILVEAKQLFAEGANETITNEEAEYYFYWGSDKEELEKVITFSEASKLFGINDSTLRRARLEGRLIEGIDCRRSGNVWLVKKKAVAKLYGNRYYVFENIGRK